MCLRIDEQEETRSENENKNVRIKSNKNKIKDSKRLPLLLQMARLHGKTNPPDGQQEFYLRFTHHHVMFPVTANHCDFLWPLQGRKNFDGISKSLYVDLVVGKRVVRAVVDIPGCHCGGEVHCHCRLQREQDLAEVAEDVKDNV